MRIGLQTWGTEGDVAPFLALAEALRQAGHRVTLVYTTLDDLVLPAHLSGPGIAFHRVGGPFRSTLDPYALVRSGSPLRQLRALLAAFHEPVAASLLEAGEVLCRDHDLVVGHMLNRTLHTAALRAGTPRVSVAFSPQAIPGAGPPLRRSWGHAVDALLWRLGDAVLTRALYPASERLHSARGLPPVRSLLSEVFSSPVLNLVAASPTLIPSLRSPQTLVTGAWTAPAPQGQATLDPALEHFLQVGPPPVYLTFGSCTAFAAQASGRLMAEAAALAGVRAIVQADPAHCLRTTDLFVLQRAPHAAVFPRCAAVVHHGGAGTVHAAARAGVPSVVVPHGFDQDWWARRLRDLGAAPPALPVRKTTPSALAAAIREVVGGPSYTQAATHLRAGLAGDAGTAAAVAALEKIGRGG